MAQTADREKCIDYLYECLEEGAFSNLIMNGENVSDFSRAAVYGTITYCFAIDFLIKHICGESIPEMDPYTRTIIRFGAWQILFSEKVPSYAAVSTSVELAHKYRPGSAGFVNAVLRKLAASSEEERNISNYRPEVAISLKPELYGVLKKCYGKDHAISIGKSFLTPSELTVRYNACVTNRTAVKADLERDGFDVHDGHFMPEALIIAPTPGVRIDTSRSFVSGEYFVQSEGAMLASRIADPKPGERILDCCSAPGGKATHMAELTGDQCEIICLDINRSRLKLIEQNAERLGIHGISCMEADSTDIARTLPREKSGFDIVTADVPCSGMGLLGRKPDIRHTLSYDRINELYPIQRAILESASSYVKSGGRLIYSTCTLNRAENEAMLQAFLDSHDDFYAEDISPFLPAKLIIDCERAADAARGYITLFPDRDLCDGFFVGRLVRR